MKQADVVIVGGSAAGIPAAITARRHYPDKRILLVAQKSAEVDDPQIEDIHEIGTLSTILQLLKLPDGTVKVLVEGAERATVSRFETTDEFFSAHIETQPAAEESGERETEVLMRSLLTLFDQYVKLNKKVPPEILTSLAGIDEPGRLADTIAAHMALKLDEKQRILEIGGPEYLSYREIVTMIMTYLGKNRTLIDAAPPLLRAGAAVLGRLMSSPPVTQNWVDYLAVDRTTDIDTMARVFEMQPARMENHLAYLQDVRWGQEFMRRLRQQPTA